MGQEQSVPTPRRTPNRLSKPRTNSSTTNLLSKSNLQLDRKDSQLNIVSSATYRYSEVPVVAVGVEKSKEEKQQKQRKRRSLFRSKSSQDKEQLTLDTGTESEFVESSPVEKPIRRWSGQAWSRSNSISEETPADQSVLAEPSRPLNRARMSLQHIPYAQHHPRLSLVAEQSPEPEPEPGPVPESKRISRYSQEITSPQLSNPLATRSNSDLDLYAPIRRRSLLQHGVATRPSLADNPRPSLPVFVRSREDLQNYDYNPAKPTSSPLSNLAIMGQVERPRVETPDEMDYRHIGAFKLGSLRITNGVASPAPSIERAATMGAENDYISAGNGRRSGEDRHRRGISNRSNTMSTPGEKLKAPWTVRSESPLRQAYEYGDEYEPLTIDTTLPILDPSLALFDFDMTQQLLRKKESPTKSQELANEYMQDIALSPYSFEPSRPSSPCLEATSKHTAIEDELFEPEPSTPSPTHINSEYAGSYNAAQRGVTGPREKPLAKADSGYSSNVSLRSLRTNGSTNAPAVPAKEPPPTPTKEIISRVASSTYSFKSVTTERTLPTNRSLPDLPTEKLSVPTQSFRDAPPVPLKHSNVYNSGRDMSAPTTPTKSPEQEYAAAQSRPHVIMHAQHARQKSMPTNFNLEDRSGSESSASFNESRWRPKKDKQRPQSMQSQTLAPVPIFTVQTNHGEDNIIPPVPYEASRHLEGRVDSFPVVCFSNTFAGFRRTTSKETLGTIFSVGSGYTDVPMGREELTLRRLQSALPAPPAPQRKPLNTTNSYQPPISPPKKLQKKLSQERSPVPRENDSLEVAKWAEAMTKQFEADAARQFANARNASGDSWTSSVTESTVMTARRSFDSIARGNPFSSRSSSWEHAPLVTQIPQQQSVESFHNQYLNAEEDQDERHLSWLSRHRKTKSPSPVSTQTQREVTSSPYGSYDITPPPSRTPPLIPDHRSRSKAPQTQPNRAPPPPPTHALSTMSQAEWKQSENQWSDRQNIWPERMKSAGKALHVKSTETLRDRKSARRPPSTHQNGNLKMRTGLDAVRVKKMVDLQMDISPSLKSYESFDNIQQAKRSEYFAGEREEEWEERKFDRNGEYNHTYGRISPNKENRIPFPEKEYYSPEPEDNDHSFQQNLHRSQNSTSDMLILDRFAGGLDYGYEPGFGLGGSAGTRNVGGMAGGGRKSVDISKNFGLDFSDVPVILRVKIEG